MSNIKFVLILIAAFLAFFGTGPFFYAVHGDGSTVSAIDMAFHIAGCSYLAFVGLRLLFDVLADYRASDPPYRR